MECSNWTFSAGRVMPKTQGWYLIRNGLGQWPGWGLEAGKVMDSYSIYRFLKPQIIPLFPVKYWEQNEGLQTNPDLGQAGSPPLPLPPFSSHSSPAIYGLQSAKLSSYHFHPLQAPGWELEPGSPAHHCDCNFTSETRDHAAENVFWKLPSAALVQSSSVLQWPLLTLHRKALSAWKLLWAREWGSNEHAWYFSQLRVTML